MSKLDELINELCPNGVEYKELEYVCNISKGIQFNKDNMNDIGAYPVINGGINPSGYIELYNTYENTITISQGGASAGYVNYQIVKFWAGAHCYVVKPKSSVLNRYLYHFLKKKEYILQECQYGAGIPALARSTILKLSIPVPPLLVQSEIVRILDNFTNLSSELESELTARKKQYEYYREKLLTFGDEVEWKTLGDCCKLFAGGDVPKHQYSKIKTAQYTIPIYSNGIGTNSIYGYTNRAKIFEPCVTIAARGTIGYCALRTEPFYPVVRLICAIPTKMLNVRYLKYILETIKFAVPTSGIAQLTIPMVSSYKIPVPPIEEQQRIVEILDRFDKLCNDISDGLPAEIEARKKQYEYYRDKLLAFKPCDCEKC